MSEGINRVTLLGNLGADPELRNTQGGTSVLNLRLATTEVYFDKDKEKQERTEWHSVVVWGPRAEGLAKFLAKGSRILVEGGLRTSSYEKDGEKRYKTEIHATNIVPCDSKREERGDADDDGREPARERGRGRDDDRGARSDRARDDRGRDDRGRAPRDDRGRGRASASDDFGDRF